MQKIKSKFPPNFIWGTATSAHQVEGNNSNNDFSAWENTLKKKLRSGKACNQYNVYKEDFKLAKKVLNNNAHRISVEWSRVEPEEGRFDLKEISHYKEVLLEMRKQKLDPVICLHHFTNPLWFSNIGGWSRKNNASFFIRFATLCSKEFGNLTNNWITINEPNVYTFMAYVKGYYPPFKKNLWEAINVYRNFINTHKKVYKIIKKDNPTASVGLAMSMSDFRALSFPNTVILPLTRWLSNYSFLDLTRGYYDYIGINHYLLYILRQNEKFNINPTKIKRSKKIITKKVSDIGWIIYPKGIYNVIKRTWNKYKIPIVITENGIADRSDKLRQRYLVDYLAWVKQAINEGMDVRGYFHWTLLDNIEWGLGREAKFGLFKTNFETMERIPRKSAYIYSMICKENSLYE